MTISFGNPKSNVVFSSTSTITNRPNQGNILLAAEDSGANINIISLADAKILATTLKLNIQEYANSKSIEFGKNGANSNANLYIETQGAIGVIDIVEDISENLFSVVLLTQNGYYVLFTRHKVIIINEISLEIVLVGNKMKHTNLYYVNMIDVILLPIVESPKEFKAYQTTTALQSGFNKLNEVIISDNDYASDNESIYQADIESMNNNDDMNVVYSSQAKRRLTKEQVNYMIKLHNNKFHPTYASMAECVKIKDGAKAWHNIPNWLEPWMLELMDKKSQCLSCAIARRQITNYFGSGIGSRIIGQHLSIDVQGPIDPPTTYGCRYWWLVVCLATGHVWVYLGKNKTELQAVTKTTLMMLNKYGHKIDIVRVDSGKVESSINYVELSEQLGFEIVASPPRDQKSNPVERTKQTLQNNLMAVMFGQANLGAAYWGPAILGVAIAWNEMYNSHSDNYDGGRKTPKEHITRIKPDAEKQEFAFGEMVTWRKSILPGTNETNNEYGFAVGHTNTATLVVTPGSLESMCSVLKQIFTLQIIQK